MDSIYLQRRMPDNTSMSPSLEITVNSDDAAVADEIHVVITIVTVPRNRGKEMVVTKEFLLPHNQHEFENQSRRMIHHMLHGTPLDHGYTSLCTVETIITDEILRLCASDQQLFFYFYVLEAADSMEEDLLHFSTRTKITEIGGFTEILWRFSAVKRVTEADASSAEKSSCAICLTELSGDDEQNDGRLPCSHLFHFDCIIRWLWQSNSCPLCRSHVASSSN